jgi:hypothetical protein
MGYIGCGSSAVLERSERTAQGYRGFRCRTWGKQFNERSAGSLDRTQYPSDVVALVVLWRLRYRLALRDLPAMFLIRGVVFSYEAVRATMHASIVVSVVVAAAADATSGEASR